MGKLTFCKIPNEEGTKFYNIKAEWFHREFSISILDNHSAWKGLVDSSEIEHFSKEHNTTADEYIKECQVAFSSVGSQNFVYSMKNERRVDETVIVLTWKKIVTFDIKLKYGSVCLRPEPLDSFIDDVWKVLDKMSEELALAKRAMEEAECEKGMLFDRIKEYQELKLEMEKTLYAKFILILNAKKKKIEELEAQLEENMCARTRGVEAPEDGVKTELLDVKTTATRGRKNATQSRRKARTREKPTPSSTTTSRDAPTPSTTTTSRRKAVEVISPLDTLPPFQSQPQADVGHGGSSYNPEYDSDTEVDEPGPSTFRSNLDGGKPVTETKVKTELPEAGVSLGDVSTPEEDVVVERQEVPSSPRRESGSSTDLEDFLAQEDPLPLSMLPKRSRRAAAAAASPPAGPSLVVPRPPVHVFNTQDLLDDL